MGVGGGGGGGGGAVGGMEGDLCFFIKNKHLVTHDLPS